MNKKTREIVFIGLYAAMSVAFVYISKMLPFQMPNGGSVQLGVIPVFVASYHLGWKKGLGVGFLGWLIGFLMGQHEWYLNPIQYALDYWGVFVIVGAASIMPRFGKISNVYTGVSAMMICSFLCTFISGAYYWPTDGVAGSAAAISYSLLYNFWYNFGTLVVAILLTPALIGVLSRSKVSQFPYIKK